MIGRTGVGLFDRALGKARRAYAERCTFAHISIPADFRAVSFCFDDFPLSAAEDGARTLESFGLRGTFYTCFGTLSHDSPSGRLAGMQDVAALHRNGHEIGCHTYDHMNCSFVEADDAAQSCDLNRRVAAERGITMENLAYPQGGIRASTKQLLSTRYATARGTLQGVNRGLTDAHGLRAVRIYEHHAASAMRQRIDDVALEGGWLILYTHDVATSPSRYGLSKSRFRDLILYTIGRNLPVLTIAEVVRLIGHAGAAHVGSGPIPATAGQA
ncbi:MULTISPECIES: polysaccharide deacetylase family protein [Rhodomicrobium]|uniref:polysaccharide deacetylase family protein n=1 Tax=Rhodomicrobium TaxID=1068 RepID=UPI0014821D3A|nr:MULTISPECIES: polysaccharide deacetylase family protein [Rhodomicrobium]